MSKVYNVPLFTYQVQFSSIQTILPAYISAICGQNPELLSLPASFQAVSTKNFFRKMLFKGVPQWRINFPLRLNAYFCRILPLVCRGPRGPGLHHCISETLFFSFSNNFLIRPTEKLSSTQKRCTRT